MPARIPKTHPRHYLDLTKVTTLAQAARTYPISLSGLYYAIDNELIAAEKLGGTYVISVASLNEYVLYKNDPPPDDGSDIPF